MLGFPFSTPKRLVKKHESSQNDLEWWWMAGKGRCNHRVITDARTSMGSWHQHYPSTLVTCLKLTPTIGSFRSWMLIICVHCIPSCNHWFHLFFLWNFYEETMETLRKSAGSPVPARKGWQSKPQPPKGPTFFLSARKRSCANASSMSCHSFKSWFCKRCCLFGEWCVMIWPG